MNYNKNNIYLKKYKIDYDGVASLPDSAYWRVMTHLGEGHFVEGGEERGDIAIILSDDENTFWPVISFLDPDEARELANELLDLLA